MSLTGPAPSERAEVIGAAGAAAAVIADLRTQGLLVEVIAGPLAAGDTRARAEGGAA